MENKRIDKMINKYGNMLYRAVYVQVGNRHDTQDILQEVFIRYLEKAPVFADEEHEKAWILQVAHHLCLDFFRFRKRHAYLELGEIEELIAGPEDEHTLRELFALPAKQKSILVLYYLEGYRIKEIAEITGLSENAVKKRLQRGRETLKAKLTE